MVFVYASAVQCGESAEQLLISLLLLVTVSHFVKDTFPFSGLFTVTQFPDNIVAVDDEKMLFSKLVQDKKIDFASHQMRNGVFIRPLLRREGIHRLA